MNLMRRATDRVLACSPPSCGRPVHKERTTRQNSTRQRQQPIVEVQRLEMEQDRKGTDLNQRYSYHHGHRSECDGGGSTKAIEQRRKERDSHRKRRHRHRTTLLNASLLSHAMKKAGNDDGGRERTG